MFVYFGSRTARHDHGRVADYCLMCHARQPFRLTRFSRYVHLFEIPLAETRTLGYVRECEACGQAYPAVRSDYTDVADNPDTDLGTLIDRTNPRLEGGVRAELAAAARLGRAAGPDDRETVLAGPFYAVYPLIKARKRAVYLDLRSGSAVAATVAALIAAAWVGEAGGDWVAALAVAGVLFVVSVALLAADPGRYARRVLTPRLARALAPLGVTPDELAALAAADPVVAKTAKWIDLDELSAAIRAADESGAARD